jgi:NADPH:quinone reductase
VQLLRTKGVNVVGIASEVNHEWLKEHGVVPVAYGDGLADRLRAAASQGFDAFIDLFGPEYVQLAFDLGLDPQRIETIIAYEKAQELGTRAEGSGAGSTTEILSEMADLVASGQIEVPIAATYPLDRVRDAYAELEKRHTRGKIVLIP